jgi:hypothetical protein
MSERSRPPLAAVLSVTGRASPLVLTWTNLPDVAQARLGAWMSGSISL